MMNEEIQSIQIAVKWGFRSIYFSSHSTLQNLFLCLPIIIVIADSSYTDKTLVVGSMGYGGDFRLAMDIHSLHGMQAASIL